MAEKSENGKPPLTQGAAPRTVLFPDSSISGKLSYNLPVKIDSRFSGEIKASDLLVVGANAQVDAHISARQLQVEGKLVGNVQVVGCFEIMPGGQFRGEGEFKVGELKVHPGAVCEGKGRVLGFADGVAQLPAGPSSP
jgi:cytoskeletal protein CcmA (bactofilin family)